jgi:hypothetical protein
MPRRSSNVVAAALAAAASFPFDAASDSGSLQDARRARWALAVDREPLAQESPSLFPKLSPSSAGIGWAKTGEAKPDCALQLELEQGWALYADWDRYRTKLPQVRDTVDTILVGLQLRFR